MINETCECLDNDEKITLLKYIESDRKKISSDIKKQVLIKNVNKMRNDLNKLDKITNTVMHIPLC